MFQRVAYVLLALALLAGIVPVTLGQEPATIRYFTFSAAPDHLEDLDQIIAAFEAERPDVNVEVATAPFADYFTLLQADIASGAAPDVFEINYESLVSLAASGALLPLDEYLSDDLPFYPRAQEAFQVDGQQLALPATFSTVLLFYNKDLFDQAGVDYPSADWTWEDAAEAASAISALGDDTWGIYSPIQFWEFYKKAAQNNCQFFNEDQTESTINAPECVEALETMVSFVEDDLMPSTEELSGLSDSELFQSGRLGMFVTGIWMFDAFKDVPFAWDVQLEPGMATKGHHFFANAVAVSPTTDNPEAAAAWAQFLAASETAAEVRVESSWELPALDQPEYFEAYLERTPPENREAVFQALESPVVPPVIERQAEMQDILNALLTQVADGELTAQEALDQAKQEIDALL